MTTTEMTTELDNRFTLWVNDENSFFGDDDISALEHDAHLHLERDYSDVNDADYDEAYELWQEIKMFCK